MKKKLKKKTKVFLGIVLIALIAVLVYLLYMNFFTKKEVKEIKVIGSIDDYGYTLKDNKNQTYRDMFDDLKKVLKGNDIEYDQYAKQITKMFVYDFYSLDDKIAKNDIGGVDFIHPDALSNFLVNAEDTYYKYVESNIYGNRNQSLPIVDESSIELGEVENTEFAIGDTNVDDAYKIDAKWTYSNGFSDYQTSGTAILVKVDKKLYIVEFK